MCERPAAKSRENREGMNQSSASEAANVQGTAEDEGSDSGLGSGLDSEEDEQVPISIAEGAGYEDVRRSESAFDDPYLAFL
jgi:hypothetical protein